MLEPLLEGFEETTGGRGVAGLDAQHSDSDGDSESWRTPPSSPPAPRRENDDADVDDEGKEEDLDALENELMEQFAEELEEELHDRDDSADPRGDEVLVRKAAWCLFEVLLPRCVGLEGQGLETRLEEPTGFSHRYDLPQHVTIAFAFCAGCISRIASSQTAPAEKAHAGCIIAVPSARGTVDHNLIKLVA